MHRDPCRRPSLPDWSIASFDVSNFRPVSMEPTLFPTGNPGRRPGTACDLPNPPINFGSIAGPCEKLGLDADEVEGLRFPFPFRSSCFIRAFQPSSSSKKWKQKRKAKLDLILVVVCYLKRAPGLRQLCNYIHTRAPAIQWTSSSPSTCNHDQLPAEWRPRVLELPRREQGSSAELNRRYWDLQCWPAYFCEIKQVLTISLSDARCPVSQLRSKGSRDLGDSGEELPCLSYPLCLRHHLSQTSFDPCYPLPPDSTQLAVGAGFLGKKSASRPRIDEEIHLPALKRH